jgi:hypothetical protein
MTIGKQIIYKNKLISIINLCYNRTIKNNNVFMNRRSKMNNDKLEYMKSNIEEIIFMECCLHQNQKNDSATKNQILKY